MNELPDTFYTNLFYKRKWKSFHKLPINWIAMALDLSATEDRKTDFYFLKHTSLNYSVKVCRGCALLFWNALFHIHTATQIRLGSSAEPHVCFLLVLQGSYTGADWTVCALLLDTCGCWGRGDGASSGHLFDLLLISIFPTSFVF